MYYTVCIIFTCATIASILSFEFVAFGSLSAVDDLLIAKISSTLPSEAKISSFVLIKVNLRPFHAI